jgi:S-(hydroxymethyl)glutathione dehydrogenase/alcohol dehydrogenase
LKAAVLEKINQPLTIRDIELTSLEVGQVLVRILVSGICGSQIHEIKGFKGNEKFLPHLMGHEGCGIVEEIGVGVTTVRVGDKVVMHWRQGAGIEAAFPIYKLDGKEFSSGKVTTLSELAIVSENRLTAVPRETDSELAALLGCSLTTALGIIDNQSHLKFGETVAIIGCGGVGLNLISGAALKGASIVYAIDSIQEKEQLVISQGADYFLRSTDELPEKVDVIIDTTGIPDVISKACNFLSNDGRLIMVGQPSPGAEIVIPNALQMFNGVGQSIRATQGGDTRPHIDIPRYLKLFSSRKIEVSQLITHRYNLDSINTAFETLKSGKSGRVIIEITEENL